LRSWKQEAGSRKLEAGSKEKYLELVFNEIKEKKLNKKLS